MAQRIVVAFDGSDGARQALGWALTAARAAGGSVEALAAWTAPIPAAPPWLTMPPIDEPRLVAEFEAAVGRRLDEVVAGAPGVDVALRVIEGPPGPALVRGSADADMLVVGRRGHGGFAGLLLGSVADHCLHHSEVPLALVPPVGGTATGAVVAGIDGSRHAATALRWAAAEARDTHRPLVALYAWSWLDQEGPFDPRFDAVAARAYATRFVVEAIGEQPAEVAVVNDLPARALLERSATGDLVVVGCRGMGTVRGALLGSVSRELAHHAPSTVVVVRTGTA